MNWVKISFLSTFFLSPRFYSIKPAQIILAWMFSMLIFSHLIWVPLSSHPSDRTRNPGRLSTVWERFALPPFVRHLRHTILLRILFSGRWRSNRSLPEIYKNIVLKLKNSRYQRDKLLYPQLVQDFRHCRVGLFLPAVMADQAVETDMEGLRKSVSTGRPLTVGLFFACEKFVNCDSWFIEL